MCSKRHRAYLPVPDTNPVLEAFLAGRFDEGFTAYQALEHPTPEDRVWASQCLMGLGCLIESYELCLVAQSEGLEHAAAFAAQAMRFTGELSRAEMILAEIDPTRLIGFGRALFERERGMLAFAHGRHREAVGLLEQAWSHAAKDATGAKTLSAFSGMLAFALSKLGRDATALQYLNRALERATAGQRPRLLILRALSHIYTGKLSQAVGDLNELEASDLTSIVSVAHKRYVRGVLARAQGLEDEAAEHLLEAASLAKSLGEVETECYAELALGAISTHDGALPMARAHLARARGVAQNLQQQALLGLRHGSILARVRDADAFNVLERVLKAFEELELERETGLAHLHLAEAHFRADQPDAGLQHLTRAVDVRHALGSGAMLAVELRGLTAVFEALSVQGPASYLNILLEDWRALETSGPGLLTLTTLGSYGVSLNGEAIKLESGAARTVEMLAFLLEQQTATLEQIQTSIYEDAYPEQARNHIHVIRAALRKTVPGLFVPYSPATKTYRVAHPGLRLSWDALEVRQALEVKGEFGIRRALALYTGPFLLRSESDWAFEFRRDLEWKVAEVGLLTVEDLFQAGRFEACVELAERMLQVTPAQEAVAVLLVRAVRELHGVLAARQRLERVSQACLSFLGEVPQGLLDLNSARWLNAN